MKRIILLVLVLCTLSVPVNVSAQSITPKSKEKVTSLLGVKTEPVEKPAPKKAPAPKPVEQPKPAAITYTVADGDNLSKIGTAHNVEWQRLWAKNTQLTSPDVIKVGEVLTIPEPSEQLQRDLPAVVALPIETPGVAPQRAPQRSFDAGNTYDFGYCTWYVKNRRGPSVPNTLGNANTWYSRAAAAGMAVGSAPRAGAVGTTTRGAEGHVVYVESVNADGSINISEMNAPIWGQATYRTASASEFVYIY